MNDSNKTITGLSDLDVLESAKIHGTNSVEHQTKNNFLISLLDIVKEPMFLLLFTATSVYFITGDYGDGIFMAIAIVLVVAISVFQESRSRNAIEALKKLSQPKCKVIRNSLIIEIPTEEIVIGDCVQLEEGAFVPADGIILTSNDFSVNESILTGESLSVFKSKESENKQVFQGTIVASGLAICEITAIGKNTQLGKIGTSLNAIEDEKTPLQIQINNFVTKMSIIGLVIFGIVWGINYYNSRVLLDSLLKALTLAMSVIPEEIPVAFTTFMALGAWRLLKMGIITKQTKTVETLGSATVILLIKRERLRKTK
jgi:P-type Ca2+ transporter type 2C